jgi:hypothetical protein
MYSKITDIRYHIPEVASFPSGLNSVILEHGGGVANLTLVKS